MHKRTTMSKKNLMKDNIAENNAFSLDAAVPVLFMNKKKEKNNIVLSELSSYSIFMNAIFFLCVFFFKFPFLSLFTNR